jgi:putative Mn2+ efflux pump MntP
MILMSLMNVISTLIGATFPYLLSHFMTELLCITMFLGYGFYMVWDALFSEETNVRILTSLIKST